MPIRIRRDDPAEPPPLDEIEQPEIVVDARSVEDSPAAVPTEPGETPWATAPPSQTSWAMVNCRCTVTGRSYQLAFRRKEGTYVLMSIDRAASPNASKDMDGLAGPFDWTAFECPECGASWSKYRKGGLFVILCSCHSLFCGSEDAKDGGLQRRKGEWWWNCPECKINQRVKIGLDSVQGQALKGK